VFAAHVQNVIRHKFLQLTSTINKTGGAASYQTQYNIFILATAEIIFFSKKLLTNTKFINNIKTGVNTATSGSVITVNKFTLN